jgi:L-threonylcarbamoyladenylate synthase
MLQSSISAYVSSRFAARGLCEQRQEVTRVLTVDPASPDPAAIAEAARVLREGGLVALPTETVYGLAALALDASAVARIFAAKGRPAQNPVIVHVADVAAARAVAERWPEAADRLAERFWPGPLTIVVPRGPAIPDLVTAGGPTVAVRVPSHPVALAVLRAVAAPLAAPSANRSMAVSPTTAQHVLETLGSRVDLILDAGPTTGGIESTVVQLEPPAVLRPGLVTITELESVLGPLARDAKHAIAPSPGMMQRPYAPRARLEVCRDDAARVEVLLADGARVGWLAFDPQPSDALVIAMSGEPREYAARLYAALHELDRAGVDRIVVAEPPQTDEWLGVRDRLTRAAH